MNRFNYPFTRITSKSFNIKNNHRLEPHEVIGIMAEDKTLQHINSLKHFYPESEGKIIYAFGENNWFVITDVTSDYIKLTSVQKGEALCGLLTSIILLLLMLVFWPSSRRFAFGFIVFCLMACGIIFIGKSIEDSRVKSKLKELSTSVNKEK
jgi:hypothetical protein